MAETELERMVLRLLTDVEGYIAPLQEAVDASKSSAKEVEDAGKKLEEFGESLQTYGKKLSMYVTAPLVAMAGVATAAFSIQEDEEIKLQGILEATGREVESLYADYTSFASALQLVTRTGDETTLGMLRTAEALGVTGEAAKLAVKESLGLAAAVEINEKSAIRYTAMLAQGDTMMLQRHIPTLRGIEDETERIAEAHRVLGNMFAIAKASAESFVGQLWKLWNATGDLMEQFGAIIAAALKPFVKLLKEAVLWLQDTSQATKIAAIVLFALAAAIGPALITLGLFIKLLLLAEGGLVSFSIAATILKAKMILYTIATKAATVATMFFHAMATPGGIALIGVGLVVATAAVVLYTQRVKEATDASKDISPEATEAGSAIATAMTEAKTAVDGVTGSVDQLGNSIKDLPVEQLNLARLETEYQAKVSRLAEIEKAVAAAKYAAERGMPGSGTAKISGIAVPLDIAEENMRMEQQVVDNMKEAVKQARQEIMRSPVPEAVEKDMDKARTALDDLSAEMDRVSMEWKNASPVELKLYDLKRTLGDQATEEVMTKAASRMRFIEQWKKDIADRDKAATPRDPYVSQGVSVIERGSLQEAILKQELAFAMKSPDDEKQEQQKQTEFLMTIAQNTSPDGKPKPRETVAINLFGG